MKDGFPILQEVAGGDSPTLAVDVERLSLECVDGDHYLELVWATRGLDTNYRMVVRLHQPGRLSLFATGVDGKVCRFDALRFERLPEEEWDVFRHEMTGEQLDEEINLKFHTLEVVSKRRLW